MTKAPGVERWGIHEIALEGPSESAARGGRRLNPFTDVTLTALFSQG